MKETSNKNKAKRAHGEGSIYPLKDSSWAGYSKYIDTETGERKIQYFYGKSQKDVAKKKKLFEAEIEKGIMPQSGQITVSQWLDEFLVTYKKNSVKQDTYETYVYIANAHLKPSLGKLTLKELKTHHVQKMLNQKSKSGRRRGKNNPGLSPRMVEHIFCVINMALNQAVNNGLLGHNVCRAVKKPKKIRHVVNPWTVKQTKLFLASVKGDRLFPFYVLAIGTGLRRSEILGLQWSDIDFEKQSLTVRRIYIKIKGACIFSEPKTQLSKRTITLPAFVINSLLELKKAQAQEKLLWNGKHKDTTSKEKPEFNPLKLVFCNEFGQPYYPQSISDQFKKATVKAGLPVIRFHDLRHGHATMLLELGVHLKVVSDRLGHSTINLTADTYSHVQEKVQREASNKLNELLNF